MGARERGSEEKGLCLRDNNRSLLEDLTAPLLVVFYRIFSFFFVLATRLSCKAKHPTRGSHSLGGSFLQPLFYVK